MTLNITHLECIANLPISQIVSIDGVKRNWGKGRLINCKKNGPIWCKVENIFHLVPEWHFIKLEKLPVTAVGGNVGKFKHSLISTAGIERKMEETMFFLSF